MLAGAKGRVMAQRDNEFQWAHRPISRRGFLASGAAAAFLAACGTAEVGQPAAQSPAASPAATGGATGAATQAAIEDELSIYNWADYVAETTYPAFEKEFD